MKNIVIYHKMCYTCAKQKIGSVRNVRTKETTDYQKLRLCI